MFLILAFSSSPSAYLIASEIETNGLTKKVPGLTTEPTTDIFFSDGLTTLRLATAPMYESLINFPIFSLAFDRLRFKTDTLPSLGIRILPERSTLNLYNSLITFINSQY